MKIRQIVINTILDRGMTVRDFANALGTSHATVINWRDGATEPGTDFLTQLMLHHRDWRYDFAYACLQAKSPEVWGSGFLSINPNR